MDALRDGDFDDLLLPDAMKETGVLYLMPVPLATEGLDALSPRVITVIHQTRHFIVENARTARRFIKSTTPPYRIEELEVVELDKHARDLPMDLLDPLLQGKPVGVMSEAGCPGIADPGSLIVRAAHAQGIRVVPLVGPSSILLALMASGLDGQKFQFHGYLSPKKEQLLADLRRLEESAAKQGTQIFIETPYRNQQVFQAALQVLHPKTMLCVAIDLTAPNEWIRTHSISEWQKISAPDFHKRPAVFCIDR